MANAKKCDRCGAYYEKNEFKTTFHGSSVIRYPACITVHNQNGDCTGYYDLCDICLADFMKFITGTPIVSEEEDT